MRRISVAARAAGGENGVEVNMSPLIDMVFLLLIFFVVTTAFVEETGLEVKRPAAASAEDISDNAITLALGPAGEIFYGGRRVHFNSVRGLVAQLLRQGEAPVVILADETARTGPLIRLIDECRLAGAASVSVAAAREYAAGGY